MYVAGPTLPASSLGNNMQQPFKMMMWVQLELVCEQRALKRGGGGGFFFHLNKNHVLNWISNQAKTVVIIIKKSALAGIQISDLVSQFTFSMLCLPAPLRTPACITYTQSSCVVLSLCHHVAFQKAIVLLTPQPSAAFMNKRYFEALGAGGDRQLTVARPTGR